MAQLLIEAGLFLIGIYHANINKTKKHPGTGDPKCFYFDVLLLIDAVSRVDFSNGCSPNPYRVIRSA
jgi:hypothetical protein